MMVFLAILTKETAKVHKISVCRFVINVINLYTYHRGIFRRFPEVPEASSKILIS